MATFGAVTSPFANVLYNPMAVDQAVQGRQRNQLMMDNARQDQAQQTFQRDATARIGMARELSALPEQEAAAQWGSYRQRLQASGLGQGLPEQFPGLERLKAVASSDMTTFQRMQLEEKRRSSEAFMGLLGGAPAASGAAPAGGAAPVVPGNLAPVISQAAQDTSVPAPLLTALFQQESRLGQDPRATTNGGGVAQIIGSTARDPGYGMPPISDADRLDPNKAIPWAARYLAARNPGVDWNDPGQRDAALRRYNGGGDPNYAQNVARHLPGAQAAAPAAPSAPAAPQLDQNGLTQQQRALVAAAGPERGIGMMAQFQQQNRMEVDRISDRQRQAERDAIQQQQQLVTNERQDAAARRADETARRQDEAANRRIRLDEERAAREANPGPSPTDRTKLKTIETEADGILGALEAYRTARTNASSTSRIASAAGLPTELNSTYGNAALLAKGEALYNLGVLNGPDLGIIRRVLADPGTVTGGMASQATVDAQIDQVKALLQQRLATARTQYGGAPAARQEQPAGGLMDGAQPPPPGRSATAPAAPRGGPQVGAVEDGYRFRGGDPSKPESWERAQ